MHLGTGFTEYQLKAAFLYNFAKFVEWTDAREADPDVPVRFCILGKDPFRTDLDWALQGKRVRGRAVEVSRIKRIDQVRACHILFVSSSERRRVGAVLQAVAEQDVLTVAEFEDFAARGGMIRFLLQDRKVRFQINASAAERVGLRISSKLLKLALPAASPDEPPTSVPASAESEPTPAEGAAP